MRRKVMVTKLDIRDGDRLNAQHCPVALAVAEALRGELREGGFPIVVPPTINWTDRHGRHHWSLVSKKCAEKIYAFDTTGKMKPFCFYLDERDYA